MRVVPESEDKLKKKKMGYIKVTTGANLKVLSMAKTGIVLATK